MYKLPYFQEKDQEAVIGLMKNYPFALLTGTSAAQVPVATQVPMLMEIREDKIVLKGHIMRHTDHHVAFMQNKEVLAVFTGPNTYVSASWYQNPHQGSTWNYMSVHASGVIRFLEEEKLKDLLQETTTHFEGGADSPGAYDQLPQAYIDKLVKAIVGFEIEVSALQNVFKLSQNRDLWSYQNIIAELKKGNEASRIIAEEMQNRLGNII